MFFDVSTAKPKIFTALEVTWLVSSEIVAAWSIVLNAKLTRSVMSDANLITLYTLPFSSKIGL